MIIVCDSIDEFYGEFFEIKVEKDGGVILAVLWVFDSVAFASKWMRVGVAR